MNEKTFNDVVAHMKSTGFVYQGSEIYGGLANTWDFGPLGIELKNNIKNAWWKRFIQEDPKNVGLQSAILMNPNVWVASGHVGGFSDPLMDCKECKSRFRADQLIEEATNHEVNCSNGSKGLSMVVSIHFFAIYFVHSFPFRYFDTVELETPKAAAISAVL